MDDLSAAVLREDPHSAAHGKAELAAKIAAAGPRGRPKRVVLRYLLAPAEILGTDRVEGLRVNRTELFRAPNGTLQARSTDVVQEIGCGMVIRSIGYRGVAVAGVPFDESRGGVPNIGGRVLAAPGSSESLAGVYVVGWAKRGATGFIGTNKHCAKETVDALLDDYVAGRLSTPANDASGLAELIAARNPAALSYADWRIIDAHECGQAVHQRRPRVKLVDVQQMLDVVRD
jgi:ferredoxin--NADP+ reductase